MKPELADALVATWLTALLIALGFGSAATVALVMVAAAPAARAWRGYRVRRFRRRLRALAEARNLPWLEPQIVDERRLAWALQTVVENVPVEWKLELIPRKMTDAEIVEWLRPVTLQAARAKGVQAHG